MNDEIQSLSTQTQKNTFVSTLGLDYTKDHTFLDKYSKSAIDIYLTIGRLNFKDNADKQSDEQGAKTNGNFSKINIDLENTTAFNEKFQWKNSLKLQYALGGKNLDGSEDMSIGGINGVKFYPDGEESAENGYVLSTELLYNLPQWNNLNSQVGIFYDNGRVYMSDNFTGDKSRTLQDVGVSYSAFYKEFFFKSHLAYKVGSSEVTSENKYDSRFMFQCGWIF